MTRNKKQQKSTIPNEQISETTTSTTACRTIERFYLKSALLNAEGPDGHSLSPYETI